MRNAKTSCWAKSSLHPYLPMPSQNWPLPWVKILRVRPLSATWQKCRIFWLQAWPARVNPSVWMAWLCPCSSKPRPTRSASLWLTRKCWNWVFTTAFRTCSARWWPICARRDKHWTGVLPKWKNAIVCFLTPACAIWMVSTKKSNKPKRQASRYSIRSA